MLAKSQSFTSTKLEVIKQRPTTGQKPTPLLFVHGMYHAAWCWEEHFLPYFAQHGYTSYAFSLRGHGTSQGRENLRWTPLSDYVSDVAQVAEGLKGEHSPVIMGHSMGGLVVQKYLESHQPAAAVLLATAPHTGLLPASLCIIRRHPLVALKIGLTLNVRHNIRTPELFREAFFSEKLPQEELLAYYAKVQDESFRAFVDMVLGLGLPHPDRINTPILVLGARDDNMISTAEVKATAKAYHTQAEFFPDMGHDMMLDTGWQAVAERILTWLKRRGL